MKSIYSQSAGCALQEWKPPRMAEIHNVTGTAYIVAEFRAEENAEPEPLYRDPIVTLFLNDETKKAAGRIAAAFPPVSKMVKIRTRYLDDRLERQLGLGYRQVVILGAGLDTRAIRKQAAGVTYFEIDDAATLALKKASLEDHAIDTRATLIAADYVRDDFVALLNENGFDFNLPTHFIWEGNTMYLASASVAQVMAQIARHIRQFTLSFDYMAVEVISKTTGDPGVSTLADSFAGIGAPWIYGIGDIQTLADTFGLAVVDNFKTGELHRAYWPGRSLDSAIFEYYSLCTLQSR